MSRTLQSLPVTSSDLNLHCVLICLPSTVALMVINRKKRERCVIWCALSILHALTRNQHHLKWMLQESLWSQDVEKKRGQEKDLYAKYSVALRGKWEYSCHRLFQVCWFSHYLIFPLCFAFSASVFALFEFAQENAVITSLALIHGRAAQESM